jgi:hypothetical protein
VKAQEITFQALIQGEKQFQVPLYQRTYSWQEPQLRQRFRGHGLRAVSHNPQQALDPWPAKGPTSVKVHRSCPCRAAAAAADRVSLPIRGRAPAHSHLIGALHAPGGWAPQMQAADQQEGHLLARRADQIPQLLSFLVFPIVPRSMTC